MSQNSSRNKLLRYYAIGAFAFFFAAILAYFTWPEDEPLAWPDTAVETADAISISRLSELLEEAGEGRRAAIRDGFIFVETVPGSGELEAVEAYKAEKAALEEETSSIDPAETEIPEEVTEKSDDAEAPLAPIVKAKLPFPAAGFIQEIALASRFEVEIFPDTKKWSAMQIVGLAFQILFLGLLVFLIMMITGRGPGGSSFGTESGFEVIETEDLETSLADVAGLDPVLEDVSEVVAFLKKGKDASLAGGRMPRGLLLDGPPGTGKTHLARAMAREAGVNFIRVDASSLSQMFVGLGAIKVRRLFRKARKLAPAIVFIDEIDAVGAHRGTGQGSSGDQDRENTLNALLTELDGFTPRDGIFLIAATNRAHILDKALVRPGRIDRKITLSLPDLKARQAILAVHCRDKILAEDVDLGKISALCYQMSGAELGNLVNEAALHAGRNGRSAITAEDFMQAREKSLLPGSGGTITMLLEERHLTAVHESGHAIAAILSPHADPVEKITITPRGGALGYVLQTPEKDSVFETKARLESRILVAVAGRCAESLVFGEDMVTTGARSDIRQATTIAKAMVMQYGMSPRGFIDLDPNDSAMMDLNRPISADVEAIISRIMQECMRLLRDNRSMLDAMSQLLMEEETISGKRARELCRFMREMDTKGGKTV